MDRRKKLATAGAVSLTATAALVAVGASIGLFGLTDDSPRVGKLSPIDSTQTTNGTTPDDVETIIIDDTTGTTAPNGGTGTGRATTSNTAPGTSANTAGTPQTTVNTRPDGDDDHDDFDDDSDDHSDDDRDDSSHSDDDDSGHDDDD